MLVTTDPIPAGRRLEHDDYDPHAVGTIGPLRPATDAKLKLARRNLREIDAKNIEGDGLYLTDKTSGEEFEVVTSFVDLVDPKLTGTTAFTVRDGLLVPLRPKGWAEPVDSAYAGSIGGREAGPEDPMPVPTGLIQ